MAERRMFAKTIMQSDAFLDMDVESQVLYVFLCLDADDDGFVNKPNSIRRMIGAGEEALTELIEKKFVITFDSGVIAIKHWLINNAIRKDRYTPTKYTREKAQLIVRDNSAYTLAPDGNQSGTDLAPSGNQAVTSLAPDGNQVVTNREPDDNQWLPQDSIGKDSIVKDSIGVNVSSSFFMPSRQDLMRFLIDEKIYLPVDLITEHFKDGYPEDWQTAVRKYADGIRLPVKEGYG